MAAPTGFPSWAYNSNIPAQSALIVQSLAQFNALPGPGTWSSTPFATPVPVPSAPFDSLTNGTGNYQVTDIRLQQQLIEARITNQFLAVLAQPFADDAVTILRPDILINDASLTS